MTGFAAALYENLPFPVLILDGEASVVSHNEAAARTFGWNRDGRKPGACAVIEGANPAALLARHALEGRENAHAFSFRHDNGTLFEATAHVIAVPDDASGARYALLLRSLLSGGSHGEQILLGQRIAAALDTMNEGFAIFDEEERLIMFNRSYKERCGEARDAVRVGATLESIARANIRVGMFPGIEEGTPEAEAMVRERLESHRNTGSGGSVFEFGKDRWIRGESHVAETGDIVALRVDVSELKRTEAALEEKRREYLSLLQILPDMILRFDRNLTVRFANDKYAAHVGSTTDELIGRHLPEVACAPEQTAPLMDISAYSREKPVQTLEICMDHDGQPMWMLWTAVAIFDEDGLSEIVSVGRDITEAKRQQQQVEAQTNELRRKNEALDQFTATVSHDLKAPLRHLSMFAEMISEDLHRGEFSELPHYADHVRKSAARMRRIIDSLLEFSQIAYRINSPKPVALSGVVRDALALLESHVQECGGTVDVQPLPEVMGDPELLKRLVQNLIGNALKYRRPSEAPAVRIYSRQGPQGIDFIVEDDGIGIDPQHVGRIFEVFQRLHRDETVYQGTGVGLALARRIVESHNGVIALDTSYGPGARFVVTFPQPMKSRGDGRGGLA
ncbi:PAS domain S-box protein [Shinella zoogloeoides]|uniref:PAS domain S-box protein n=1 Tax=Shinella zoogloeoides TaxID=352475 RepID=UPI00273F369D|nr:PAS domain S-box protein [Shinella zoogloeoides]WLR94415.1 PAS domain S-box protein [Shinella zoogloeoides]